MDWKSDGGTIINKSGKTLIVAFDHPSGKGGWAYMPLSHNRKTTVNIDADGFRVRDEGIKISYSNPGNARFGWWKIRNGMLATVFAGRDTDGNNCVNFEVEAKILFPLSLFGSPQAALFSAGASLLSPAPRTNEDFGWDGTNMLIAEASEPVS